MSTQTNKKIKSELEKFTELTISGWHNELEGKGYNINVSRVTSHTAIPKDIKIEYMKSLINLFEEIYEKKLGYEINVEKPERMSGSKEPISKRVISVWYKNNRQNT